MPPRLTDDSTHDAMVRAAITHAEARAGRNNVAFLKAFRDHFHAARQSATGHLRMVSPAGAPGGTGASTGPRSFHIFTDPRYLKNARDLARRTLGGTRVVGGTTVKAGAFPDCVAVGNDAQWGCTGTLIAPNVVVTAGHCADFATRVFFGNDVSKPGTVVKVKKRVRHPRYHRGKHNDLMVLLLEHAVGQVAPRAVAAAKIIEAATGGRVVGFGATDPSGVFGYGVKRQVDVPIASPACKGQAGGEDDPLAYGCDRNLELVAGRPLLEQDSCNGDSGGPFYVMGAAGDWLLAAATSRATDSAPHNCGDGGIYVRLDKYRRWIDGIPGVTLP